MPSILSKPYPLVLLTGLGALAAGSLACLFYLKDKDRYIFRRKKPDAISDHPGSADGLKADFKILKEVPLLLFEQSNGFSHLQEELGSLVDIQAFPLIDLGDGDDGAERIIPETVNNYYKYIQIEGYRQDVLDFCQAIDQLITVSGTDNFQIFELRSSQVKSILGHKNSLIRNIEKESGAKVIIGEFDPNWTHFTTVQIIGSDTQIREAYKLMDSYLTKDRRWQSSTFGCSAHLEDGRPSPTPAVPEGMEDSEEEFVREQIELQEKKKKLSKSAKNQEQAASAVRTNRDAGSLLPIRVQSPIEGGPVTFGDIQRTLSSFTVKLEPIPTPTTSTTYSLILPLKVYISHIISPAHFYLQLADPSSNQLDYLEDELREFYDNKENRHSCVYDSAQEYSHLIGDFVACPVYFEAKPKYIRSIITRLLPQEEAPMELPELANGMPFFELYALDYGMTESRRLDEFFKLNGDFLSRLQFQAVKCSLMGVAPAGGEEWSEKAVDVMKHLTYEAMWMDVTSIFCRGYDRQTQAYQVQMLCRDPHEDRHDQQANHCYPKEGGVSSEIGPFSGPGMKACGHSGSKLNRSGKRGAVNLADELVNQGLARPFEGDKKEQDTGVNLEKQEEVSREEGTSSPELINVEDCKAD